MSPEHAPNAFELAILERIVREHPSLVMDVSQLAVRRRTYTGVGSFTDFVCGASGEPETIHLGATISVPGVPDGMGAVLCCRGQHPTFLETFTLRESAWDGASEGFALR